MEDTTLHGPIILAVCAIATIAATLLYRKYKPRLHEPQLHVVGRVVPDGFPYTERNGSRTHYSTYGLQCGLIYSSDRKTFCAQMREGDLVLCAQTSVLYQLLNRQLVCLHSHRRIHIRVDTDSGDRYMLVRGTWRLAHVHGDYDTINRIGADLHIHYTRYAGE